MTTIAVPQTIDGGAVRHLRVCLAEAFANPGVRVVTLAGAGSCFCRGMDLAAALDTSRPECDTVEFAACMADIQFAPKPVIAFVEGPASGGGVGLAAAADLVLATPAAAFGLTELLFGLVPAIILPCLLERIRPSTVRLWGLSGQTWSAAEARSAGLVALIGSWAKRLARAEPSARALWKRHTAGMCPSDFESGTVITARLLRDSKVKDRIRRFVEEEQLPWLEVP